MFREKVISWLISINVCNNKMPKMIKNASFCITVWPINKQIHLSMKLKGPTNTDKSAQTKIVIIEI